MSLPKAVRRKAYESKSGDLPEILMALMVSVVLCVVKTLRTIGDGDRCIDMADRNLRYCLVCVRSVPSGGSFYLLFNGKEIHI